MSHKCIRRELRQELGVGVEIGIYARPCSSIVSFYWPTSARYGRDPHGNRIREFRWVAKEELKELQMPTADEALQKRFLHGGLWDLAVV